MKVIVTGAAGFIGYHVADRLLRSGAEVVGIDNLDPYYDVGLKERRLGQLTAMPSFRFEQFDLADSERLAALMSAAAPSVVVHLAAQAGVRHSLDHPFAYTHANVTGHLSVLEACRACSEPPLLIYASSSSVYGANTETLFSEDDRVDRPVSLYAATKRAAELMSHTYAHLYGLRLIGLRFFTVYGPWGRPDMAYWLFAERILAGEPIPIFNNGALWRDFTYVDDVTEAIQRMVTRPAVFPAGEVTHRLYNVGNNRPVPLMRFVSALEAALGRTAEKDMLPMQPGDVTRTAADIARIQQDYGFRPGTDIETGLSRFVEWLLAYRADRSDPSAAIASR